MSKSTEIKRLQEENEKLWLELSALRDYVIHTNRRIDNLPEKIRKYLMNDKIQLVTRGSDELIMKIKEHKVIFDNIEVE